MADRFPYKVFREVGGTRGWDAIANFAYADDAIAFADLYGNTDLSPWTRDKVEVTDVGTGKQVVGLTSHGHAILETLNAETCPICKGPKDKPNTIPSGIAPRDRHIFADRDNYREGGRRKVCDNRFHKEGD